ncbi:MAG TPA: DUF4439 domain-containing protein [Arthrobacter sp.]|nr:DUF4439 domain-containing protein [Arthrobacter sp.]
MRPFQYAVLALAALVVLSLGFALIPAEKPAPAEPPFSERARAAALSSALEMRTAGLGLAAAGAADSPAVGSVVTLLTIQARALMAPASGSPSAPTEASMPPAAASPSADAGPQNTAELVQALAASGSTRLKDAETADGGMARLLAGTGTAQLLAAAQLASAAGVPVPQETAGPGSDVQATPQAASSCPSPSAPAATVPSPAALAAAVSAEQQAVYGYQAALPRLAPADAGPASDFLAAHKELAAAAVERLRLACGPDVPQQPGYVLDPAFLAAPAAALGKLEAATLAAYGDLVAAAQGQDRKWALAALQPAAARTLRWGADPGPVPGLTLDEGQLPALPAGAGRPAGATPAASPVAS